VERGFYMKFLDLGFRIFCRNTVLNLILVCQLAASLVLVNITLGQLNGQRLTLTFFESIAGEKGAYFMPSIEDYLSLQVDALDTPERYSILEELSGVKAVSACYQFTFYREGEIFEAFAYDSYMSEKIRLPLLKGVWFTEFPAEEGVVPVVVGSEDHGFIYGQTIPVNIRDADTQAALNLKVVGVLRQPLYALGYSRGGTTITGNDIFERYDENYRGGPLIIFSREALAEYRDCYFSKHVNRLVFFDENIGSEEYLRNLELMSTRGFVQTIDEMYALGRKEIGDNIKSMLPFIICTFSIAAVGLASLTILNAIRQRKIFAIYYLCGSKWKDCFKILAGYLLTVIILSLSLLAFVYGMALLTGNFYRRGLFIYISFNNLLATLGLCLVVIILSLVIPYLILKNTYPAEILREN
jgi:hypothetical protein